MHSLSFYHRSTRFSDSLHYLVLRLPAQTFKGLFARRLLPPYSLYPPSGAIGIWPLGLFCFTRCFPNTLDFWRKNRGLRSILEGYPYSSCCSTFSRGGSEFVGEISDRFSKIYQKGVSEVSAHVLYVSAQYGFMCPFRLHRWVYALVAGVW